MGHELAKGLANARRVLSLIELSAPSYPMADRVLAHILPDEQLGEAVQFADMLLDEAMPKLEAWQQRVEAEGTPSRLLEWSAPEEGKKPARKRRGSQNAAAKKNGTL